MSRFTLANGGNFFMGRIVQPWQRLPGAVGKSPFVEGFKRRVHVAPGDMARWFESAFPNLSGSMDLLFPAPRLPGLCPEPRSAPLGAPPAVRAGAPGTHGPPEPSPAEPPPSLPPARGEGRAGTGGAAAASPAMGAAQSRDPRTPPRR